MREAITGRDRLLLSPRSHGPGVRKVEGRLMYSVGWLDAPGANPDAPEILPQEEAGVNAAEPRSLPGYCLHAGLEDGRVTSIVFTAKDQEGVDEILPALLELNRRLGA